MVTLLSTLLVTLLATCSNSSPLCNFNVFNISPSIKSINTQKKRKICSQQVGTRHAVSDNFIHHMICRLLLQSTNTLLFYSCKNDKKNNKTKKNTFYLFKQQPQSVKKMLFFFTNHIILSSSQIPSALSYKSSIAEALTTSVFTLS